MNIEQLESFNLADAVKFHDKLNPLLWDKNEHLHPEISEQLLTIASDFSEFLGVKNLDLKDITISGSNAAFSYTPHSDIDLHLIVDLGNEEHKDVYRELFDAKKFIYNNENNITIKGIPVELYVQDANEQHHSQGIYSIVDNNWIQIPKRRQADIDDVSVKSKYKDLSKRIKEAIKSKSVDNMTAVMDKIRNMRGAGLADHGEFGPENLAFKLLRNKGDLEKLSTAKKKAKNLELSLKERKPQMPITYGYGPDYIEEVGITPDGTNPSTCMFTKEDQQEDKDIIQDFVNFCKDNLELHKDINLRLKKDPQWSVRNKTFGRYNDNTNELEVGIGGRHIMDVLRTIAHELVHQKQNEIETVPNNAGEDGSPWENEANARAGVLMRKYAQLHPELFAIDNETIAEGFGKKLAAASAIISALMANPAAAQSVQGILVGARDLATMAKTAQNITRAGINQEVQQEITNYIKANGGQPNAQNLSHLYQLQKQLQNQEPNTLPGYTQQSTSAINESSGYIPTAAEANDPRYKMALSVDVHPGAIGKAANAFLLDTDSQGHPQELRADGIVHRMAEAYELYKRNVDESL